MRKYLIFFGLIFSLFFSANLTEYIENRQNISGQVNFSQRMMSEKVAPFVQKWSLAEVPLIFSEYAIIGQIDKILIRLKQEAGSCQMTYIGICRSTSDKIYFPTDEYLFTNGASVRCPFELSCEKVSMSGTAIFFPNRHQSRLYKLILTYLPHKRHRRLF